MNNQTIDGVSREFVREGRYIVVKPDYEDDIRTERLRNYIEEMCFHTPDCVVVEADWPEYEPVCRMIEARVIGNPTELDAAKATISQLQGLVAELRALLDAPAKAEFSIPDCPDCACVQDGQCLCIPSKPAAQRQGEPVAWLDQVSGAIVTHKLKPLLCEQGFEIPLYAEQPVPVAVTLSAEEICFLETIALNPGAKLNGGIAWNAEGDPMWDRLEGLGLIKCVGGYRWKLAFNAIELGAKAFLGQQPAPVATARPAHANPLADVEPCGSHHDNDGLDNYRK